MSEHNQSTSIYQKIHECHTENKNTKTLKDSQNPNPYVAPTFSSMWMLAILGNMKSLFINSCSMGLDSSNQIQSSLFKSAARSSHKLETILLKFPKNSQRSFLMKPS